MRSLPAQRLLSSHADVSGYSFNFKGQALSSSLIVFSPVMLMPVVVAFAKSIALNVFGSSSVLDAECEIADSGKSLLGVIAKVGPADGSPQGLIRASLLAGASDLIFRMHAKANVLDLADVIAAYEKDVEVLLSDNMLSTTDPELLRDVSVDQFNGALNV